MQRYIRPTLRVTAKLSSSQPASALSSTLHSASGQKYTFSSSSNSKAKIPVWFLSMIGNKRAMDVRFNQNRAALRERIVSPGREFNPVLDLIDKSSCDHDGKLLLDTLEQASRVANLQPIIRAAGLIARLTNFQLYYLSKFPYIREKADGLLHGLLTHGFYNLKDNTVVVKKEGSDKEAETIVHELIHLVDLYICGLPSHPTHASIELCRLRERYYLNRMDDNAKAVETFIESVREFFPYLSEEEISETYDDIKGRNGILIRETMKLHSVLMQDLGACKYAEDAMPLYKEMRELVRADRNWDNPLTPPDVKEVKAHVFSLLLKPDAEKAIMKYLPNTWEYLQEAVQERCKRFVVREHLVPYILSRLSRIYDVKNGVPLSTGMHNGLEELLNERALMDAIYDPNPSSAQSHCNRITKLILEHLIQNDFNKDNLRSEIIKFAQKIELSNLEAPPVRANTLK